MALRPVPSNTSLVITEPPHMAALFETSNDTRLVKAVAGKYDDGVLPVSWLLSKATICKDSRSVRALGRVPVKLLKPPLNTLIFTILVSSFKEPTKELLLIAKP